MLRLKHVVLTACCFFVVAQCRFRSPKMKARRISTRRRSSKSPRKVSTISTKSSIGWKRRSKKASTRKTRSLPSSCLFPRCCSGAICLRRPCSICRSNDPQQRLRSMQFRQFALNDLQRAVQLDEKLWEAHLLIGKLQALGRRQRGPAGAVAGRRRRGRHAGQQAEALALRSTVQRDDERKMADINRAVELDARIAGLLAAAGAAFLQRREIRRGARRHRRALKLEADHAASHELRGMILLGLERYDDALKSFDRASELAPRPRCPTSIGPSFISKKAIRKKPSSSSPRRWSLRPTMWPRCWCGPAFIMN